MSFTKKLLFHYIIKSTYKVNGWSSLEIKPSFSVYNLSCTRWLMSDFLSIHFIYMCRFTTPEFQLPGASWAMASPMHVVRLKGVGEDSESRWEMESWKVSNFSYLATYVNLCKAISSNALLAYEWWTFTTLHV